MVVLDAMQDERGLHDRGRAAETAGQFGQDFPGLEHGDGPLAAGQDAGVAAVDGLLAAGQLREPPRDLVDSIEPGVVQVTLSG